MPLPLNVATHIETIDIDLSLKDNAVIHDGRANLTIAAPNTWRPSNSACAGNNAATCASAMPLRGTKGFDPAKPFPNGTRAEVSNSMRRRKRQIGTLHAKIADQHHNHQHQFTARAVASAQVIAIE